MNNDVGITTEGEVVFADDLAHSLVSTREWLSLKLDLGECSEEIEMQLARSLCRIPQKFGDDEFLIDFHCVCDQIERLEGKSPYISSGTKPQKAFKRSPLKGLWHSHWFQAGFMMRNIALELEFDQGLAAFEQAIGFLEKVEASSVSDDLLSKALSYALVVGGYERRARRGKGTHKGSLTGEWIVFAKSNERNIYLTLASHREDEHAIMKRCVPAIGQFPELGSHAAFIGPI